MQVASYPSVSVIIPTLDEEKHINRCIHSLLDSKYPSEKMEILVVDGGSKDQTIQIVTELIQNIPRIKILNNPKIIVSSAMNLGVESAKGEIIVWAGAHAKYDENYIPASVNLLIEKSAASVGGIIQAKGRGMIGKAIAATVSCPIGAGNAKYRISKDATWVDTVFAGCWWKKDFLKVGGFNENWLRNQDAEFNYRLRKEIGGIYMSPDIISTYYVRESLIGLAKQYFQYGFWRARTASLHPKSIRLRQIIPVIFSLIILILLTLSWTNPVPLVTVLLIYFGSIFGLALKYNPHLSLSTFLIPVCGFIIHFSWGLGFMASFVSNIWKK